MKKTLTIATGLLIALVWSAMAMAVGTANSWYVELTFSTLNSADRFPVRLGEGAQADSLMKPPSVPGKKYNAAFTPVIRASVLTDDSLKAVWRIDAKGTTTAPAKVWPIVIETEEADLAVSMQVDLAEFPTNLSYKLLAIDPVTGVVTTFDATGQSKAVFTSDLSGSRVIYVLAGTSQTFLVSNGTTAFGMVHFYKSDKSAQGANLYNFDTCSTVDTSGCSVIATAGPNGVIDISSLPAGDYNLRLDAPNVIGAKFSLSVTAGGSDAAAVNDLYLGDLNDDGVVNISDVGPIKKCFGSKLVDPPPSKYEARCDLDGDGIVNISDVGKLKPGFGKYECWMNNSCN